MLSIQTLLENLLQQQKLAVPPEQVSQLVWLADELLRWSRSRNLTAISRPDEVVEKHLVDCLTLAPHVPETGRLLDIGSGAGFPALPLKIVKPCLDVVSVDAVAKKIMFQRHVARALRLEKFMAVHGRVEACLEAPGFENKFDLITARAVGRLVLLLRLAGPLLKSGGQLVAMKGPEGLDELAECREQLVVEGWSVREKFLTLPISGAGRWLLFFNHNNG